MSPEELASTYAAVFAATPLPMIILAVDAPRFSILEVNEVCCRTMHIMPDEIVGKGASELVSSISYSQVNRQNDTDQLLTAIERAATRGKRQPIFGKKFTIRDAAGTGYEEHYWTIVISPVKNETGAVINLILSVENVDMQVSLLKAHTDTRTQLAGAQQEAAEATEGAHLLEAIVDKVQAGVFLFTAVRDDGGEIIDFRFRMANPMLAAYVGQTAQTVVGGLGSDWFPGYKVNGLFERYKETLITGITDRFEFHYDHGGIDVWLDILITKVGEDLLVTFTDYTSLKNLQRRLEDHVTQLKASNANLEQFAYIASHDLQEPLRKIKSFGDMLQARYASTIDASGTDLIERMQSAAARMGILINDLLTYSRVSVKPANPERVDTNKVLEEVLFDLEQSIRQQKAKIVVGKLQPVRGQATQIGQLFLNILSNALKFHHPDRSPEIRIESDEVRGNESGMAIAPEQAGQRFQRIRISDNGIGFERDYRDKIFQIFQRLHSRAEYPGTGVGLSIVQKVVENHHGYIVAEGKPEEGATFTILLPKVD